MCFLSTTFPNAYTFWPVPNQHALPKDTKQGPGDQKKETESGICTQVNTTTSLLKLGCFWRRRMSTGSGLFSFFRRLSAIKNTNLEALWLIKREGGSLLVYLRRSKPSLLKQCRSVHRTTIRDETIAAQHLSVMRVPRVVFMVAGQKPFHPTSVWISESRFSVFQPRSIECSSPA